MPLVSVLLPVRDAGSHLDASLASLWRQTLRDFEVIAVDDGSRDDSGERLDREARRESRLRVLHTPPRGLPLALNLALERAAAPWIARHDADDLSHSRRLELQRDFLEHHPEVGVVGAKARLFPQDQIGAGMRRWIAWHNGLLDHDAMVRDALIDSPLAHGTAMIRREPLKRAGGWAERGWPEDLDLWLRLIRGGVRFAKLGRVLYGWRQHPRMSTRAAPRYRVERFDALRLEALARGPLRAARRVTLVGVGRGLDRWTAHLGRAGLEVDARDAPRPPRSLRRWQPPLVLVFGAAAARARWRTALASDGIAEPSQAVFVA